MKRQSEKTKDDPGAMRRLYVVGIDPAAEGAGRRRAVVVPLKRLVGLSRVDARRRPSPRAEN